MLENTRKRFKASPTLTITLPLLPHLPLPLPPTLSLNLTHYDRKHPQALEGEPYPDLYPQP